MGIRGCINFSLKLRRSNLTLNDLMDLFSILFLKLALVEIQDPNIIIIHSVFIQQKSTEYNASTLMQLQISRTFELINFNINLTLYKNLNSTKLRTQEYCKTSQTAKFEDFICNTFESIALVIKCIKNVCIQIA